MFLMEMAKSRVRDHVHSTALSRGGGHKTRPISAISTPQAGRGHSTPSASKAIANHNEQLKEINGRTTPSIDFFFLLKSARKPGMRMNLCQRHLASGAKICVVKITRPSRRSVRHVLLAQLVGHAESAPFPPPMTGLGLLFKRPNATQSSNAYHYTIQFFFFF